MSNLGTVYEISLGGGYKNIYPVVYRNKSKLYCKIYGCDDLEVVYAEDCPYNYNKKVVPPTSNSFFMRFSSSSRLSP